MRAVILATGWTEGRLAPGARWPAPLLLLVDRPIIERACGALVGAGVTRVEWVLRSDARDVAAFLGAGARWGLKFQHHLVPDEPNGFECAGRLLATRAAGERLLLGRADRLADLSALAGEGGAAVVLAGTGSESHDWRWSGWAVLSGDTWRVPTIRDERHLETHLEAPGTGGAGSRRVRVSAVRALGTVEDYLDANQAELQELDQAPSDPPGTTGRWGPGIRVSPSASVHATATLVAPVSIGARCEVAAGATVGPHVTVGANCVIDRGAVVTDAVILPGTYVAEGARLEAVVAEPDRVIVSGGDGAVVVTAGAPVGSLTDHWPGRGRAAVGRWRGRAARLATHLRGLEKSLRRSISERWGTADQPGVRPDAVPLVTRTN